MNDACVILGKPNVYGSIFRFEGQASVLATETGPCYRCLFRDPPPPGLVPSCAEGGVLGVLPGLIGVIQATEAIKLLTGIGEPLVGRLLLVDALRMQFRTLKIHRDPLCPACGTREIQSLIDYEQFCGLNDEDTSVDATIPELTPAQLAARIERGDDFDLIDVREPQEWAIAQLPGARLVPLGTLPARWGRSTARARSWSTARVACAACARPRNSARPASGRCRTSPAASCAGAPTSTPAYRRTDMTFLPGMPVPCCCDRCMRRSGRRHVRWSSP